MTAHEVELLELDERYEVSQYPGTFEQSYATFGPSQSDLGLQVRIDTPELNKKFMFLTLRVLIVHRPWFEPAKVRALYCEVLYGPGAFRPTGRWACLQLNTRHRGGSLHVQDHPPRIEF